MTRTFGCPLGCPPDRAHSRSSGCSLPLSAVASAALALLMAVPLGAQAQAAPPAPSTSTPPTIGDVLRQTRPVDPPSPKAAAVPALGGATIEPPLQRLPGGGTQVQVDSIQIVGNRVIDTAVLAALVQGDAGKRYDLAGLEAVATKLTRHYRALGYFVARAYVPAQEIKDGKLILRVVEGNYGKFMLSNRSRVRDDIVQGLLDDIKDRDIVSLDTLERAMLIINDTPGVKVVRADVMPGQAVGTSDFAVGTQATAASGGYLLLDNHGSLYTGRTRLSGSADWNSPSARGDRLTASGMVSDRSGLLNGRLAYSGLIRTDGSRAEVALARTQYELGQTYAALNASGTADALELNLSHPLKRTRNRSIEATLGTSYRALRDEVASTATVTKKTAATLTAGISLKAEETLLGFDGLTTAGASITAGQLDFKDAAAQALDAAGARTQGSYARLNLNAARVSLLPMGWSLSTQLRLQAALNSKNLDGSERLGVSGPGAVAAYASGELSGDHAAVLRAEVAHALPVPASLGVQLSASAFANYGWARAAKAAVAAGAGTDRELADVGLGLNATLPKGGFARLLVAHRVSGGAPTSEPTPRTKAWLQAGIIF